jgi:hypothetical protein
MRTVKVDSDSSKTGELDLHSDDLSVTEDIAQSGLLLRGKILDRTRRYIPMGRSPLEVVTYILVDSENKKYYVDDLSPDAYYSVNDIVTLPVYVKPYKKKNDSLSYNLCVQKHNTLYSGEHF